MKTSTRVFMIIALVSGVLGIINGIRYFFDGIELYTYSQSSPTHIFAVEILFISGGISFIYGVLSIIFSSLSLRKIAAAKRASDIPTGFKVATLFFTSLIAGILFLCMKDKDYDSSLKVSASPAYGYAPPPAEGKESGNCAETLLKYKQLLDNGTITEEEYNKLKKEILNI